MVRRTLKRSPRRASRKQCASRKQRGAGWADGPDSVRAGYLVHHPFSGPGKDCTGNPESIRPGHVYNYTPKGLPGMAGGYVKGGYKKRILRKGGMPIPPNTVTVGGAFVGVGEYAAPYQHYTGDKGTMPVYNSITPKSGWMNDTTGAGGSVAHPGNVKFSMPGVSTTLIGGKRSKKGRKSAKKQQGGRYGFFPELGPLNPNNGVGVTPAPFGRIACERGTMDPLNPNPGDIQQLTTAPKMPPVMNAPAMKITGGGANFPIVKNVGDFDSMKYEAPNAGYRNNFMTFSAPSPVPGLTIQTPYNAGAFNQACIKTGGGVADESAPFSKLTMGEITTRKDFDGSNGLLPVKFGGKRRTHRRRTHRRRTHRRRTHRRRTHKNKSSKK